MVKEHGVFDRITVNCNEFRAGHLSTSSLKDILVNLSGSIT